MTFSVYRAEVEELIAKRIALLVLREDILQRLREFSKPRSFRPFTIALLLFRQGNI